MKKLYSLRIETELLEALRKTADQQGISVTALMHTLLADGLESKKEAKQEFVHRKDLEALAKKLESLERVIDRVT